MDRRRFIQTLSAAAFSGGFPTLGGAFASDEHPPCRQADTTTSQAVITTDKGFPTRVGVIAIGGAASVMLRKNQGNLPQLQRSIAIDDNPFTLQRSGADVALLIKSGDSARGIREMQQNFGTIAARLVESVRDLHLVFVVAGLGGVVGTALAPKVTEMLAQQGIFSIALAVTPFMFEETRRQYIATAGLSAIGRRAGVTIEIANRQFEVQAGSAAKLAEALDFAPRRIAEIYRTTLKPISEAGLVGVDFEDVSFCLLSSGTGGFATASAPMSASGDAFSAALAELAQQVGDLRQLSGIVAVLEGDGISMRHVDTGFKTIRQSANADLFLILSAHQDDSLAGHFRVGLIANKHRRFMI